LDRLFVQFLIGELPETDFDQSHGMSSQRAERDSEGQL
jgi:hypothetical protein